jgi:hypothetical protein
MAKAKAKLTTAELKKQKEIIKRIEALPGVESFTRLNQSGSHPNASENEWDIEIKDGWGWPDAGNVEGTRGLGGGGLALVRSPQEALKVIPFLVDFSTYLPPGVAKFESWAGLGGKEFGLKFTNGKSYSFGPNRQFIKQGEGTAYEMETLADRYVGDELADEIIALPYVDSLEQNPDYSWTATLKPGWAWIARVWDSSGNFRSKTLSGLRSRLARVENKLSTEPPDWRPDFVLPEDYYVGAGKTVKAKAGAKAKPKADDKTRPPTTLFKIAKAHIKAVFKQRPAAKLDPAQEREIIKEIKAHPGVVGLDFLRFPFPEESTWRAELKPQWGWPGDYEHAFISLRNLPDALKAVNELVDLDHYLPPGIAGAGQSLTSDDWTIQFTNGKTTTHEDHGSGGVRHRIFTMEALADKYVGEQLQEEIKALPSVAGLQRVVDPDKVTAAWNAYLNFGYGWDVPGILPTFTTQGGETYINSPTLSQLVYRLRSIVDRMSAVSMHDVDWRPNYEIPEDYYSGVGAGPATRDLTFEEADFDEKRFRGAIRSVDACIAQGDEDGARTAAANAMIEAEDANGRGRFATQVSLANAAWQRVHAAFPPTDRVEAGPAAVSKITPEQAAIIQEIKSYPGVYSIGQIKASTGKKDTYNWTLEVRGGFGWPGDIEIADDTQTDFFQLPTLGNALKAARALVDLSTYLPPGVEKIETSGGGGIEHAILINGAREQLSWGHGARGVLEMQKIASRYAGKELEAEIRSLPQVASLEKKRSGRAFWHAYLKPGFSWDVNGLWPTRAYGPRTDTVYIKNETLSGMRAALDLVVNKFDVTPPDWRPNESIPEDYYANVGAGVGAGKGAGKAKAAKVKPSKAKQLTHAQEQAMVREIKSHPGVFALDHYNEGWMLVLQPNWGWPAEDADMLSTAIPNLADVLKLTRSLVDFRTYLPPGIESFGPSDAAPGYWEIKFSDGSLPETTNEELGNNVPPAEKIGRLSVIADEHVGPFLQAEIRAHPGVARLFWEDGSTKLGLSEGRWSPYWWVELKPGYDKDGGMFHVNGPVLARRLWSSTLSEMLARLDRVVNKFPTDPPDWRPAEVIPEDYYARAGTGKHHAPAHADRCDALCKLYPGSVHCLDSQAATECATAVLAAFDARMHHESTFRGVLFSVEDHGFKMLHLAPGGGTLADFVKKERGGPGAGTVKRSKRSAHSYVLLTKGHVMAWRNGKLTDTTELGAKGEGGARPLLAVATFAEATSEAQPEEEF